MSETKSLCEAFQRTAAAHADRVALRNPGGEVEITWGEYATQVRRIAAGLATLGVTRGDTVGFMLANRPEFHLCDTAVMHLGATPFSVYNTSAPDQISYILGNAGTSVMICEAAFAERLLAAGGDDLQVVCIDGWPEGTVSLDRLVEQGAPDFDFDAAWQAVGPQDLLTLIYTSGTTGPPKGVEITHAGVLAMLDAVSDVLPLSPDDRIVSYLPAAHLADRLFSGYQSLVSGRGLTCLADPRQLGPALLDARPTLWLAVPRVWEKLKAAIEAGMAREPDPQRQEALRAPSTSGFARCGPSRPPVRGEGPGPDDELRAEYANADAAVLSQLRGQLGLDQVTWSASGAAPIAAVGARVLRRHRAAHPRGVGHVRARDRHLQPPGRGAAWERSGIAMPGYDIRLAPDGEILARGPGVMRGYRHDPEKTAETIDADGWLHTGDIGTMDADGYYSIVDRKKELIINSGGKNMSPVNIESKLKSANLLIGQAVAIGDCRSYNVALIVLDPDACAAHAAGQGLPSAAAADLCTDPGVRAIVEAAVAKANSQLSRIEQIKRFADPAGRLVAGRRRADADLEAEAQADRRQVRRRHRRPLRRRRRGLTGAGEAARRALKRRLPQQGGPGRGPVPPRPQPPGRTHHWDKPDASGTLDPSVTQCKRALCDNARGEV